MSEREAVMEYLWERVLKAWRDGDVDEAQACEKFYNHLEDMTETQYERQYDAPVEAGDIA